MPPKYNYIFDKTTNQEKATELLAKYEAANPDIRFEMHRTNTYTYLVVSPDILEEPQQSLPNLQQIEKTYANIKR